jgi:acyl-CoA thioester hydrolase
VIAISGVAESVSVARAHFTFAHSLRVRWAEVDRQGIVFNGHYLLYFDVAVTEYWRAIGCPYPDGLLAHGSDLFVKKSMIEYHASARYDDVLDILVRVGRIGRSSIQFLLEIHCGATHLVDGEIVYVNADPVSKQTAAVPAFLREAIARFEKIRPEGAPSPST